MTAQGAKGKEELNCVNGSAGPLDFTRRKGQERQSKTQEDLRQTLKHKSTSQVLLRDYCTMNYNTNALVLQECETLLNTVYV